MTDIPTTRQRGRRPKICKRTAEQKAHDIAFCSELFLRGYTYQEMSVALNKENARRGVSYTITRVTVFHDMKQLLIQWKKEQMNNIDDYVAQELRKLDKIEKELWEAWEKSKRGVRKKKSRTNSKPRKVLDEDSDPNYYGYEEKATETSAGNPKFLDLLLAVQQRRAKMLGFDAPVKIEIPGLAKQDDDTPKYDIAAIPDNLLFAVADKLQGAEYEKVIEDKGLKEIGNE